MRRPLEGVRVLVLRPEHQAGELARLLERAGATPVVVPAIRILPPAVWGPTDAALQALDGYDWIVFTSVNGVATFTARAAERDVAPDGFPRRVGAIGPGTARALQQYGLDVDWMPDSFTSAALAGQLPDPPARVLLVRADIATTELEDRLAARGFDVDRLSAYRTAGGDSHRIRAGFGECDAVALTSASIAASLAGAVSGSEPPAVVCSIGPATSEACRRHGLEVSIEATEHTMRGLVGALADYFRDKNPAPAE